MPPRKVPTIHNSSEKMIQKELFDPKTFQYIQDNFDNLKKQISKHSRHDDETTYNQIKCFYSMRKDMEINGKKMAFSEITYCQRRGQGRYFANHGNSLQGIARTVRHTVTKDIYYDMDIKNAHPVILQHMCVTEGRECKQLDDYINNRKDRLEQMWMEGMRSGKLSVLFDNNGNMNQNDRQMCEEWAKKQYLKITNWGFDDSSGEPKPDTHIFKTYTEHGRLYMQECRSHHIYFSKNRGTDIDKDDFKNFEEYKRSHGKTTNFRASYMNSLMCDWENKILQEMIKSFGKQHPEMKEFFIPCFDGVMIPKIDLNGNSIVYDISIVMKNILDCLHIPVLILEKPMNNFIDLPNDLPEYVSLEFNDFGDYKIICDDSKVFNKEIIDKYVNSTIFLLENPPMNGKEKFKFITKHVEHDYGTNDPCVEYKIEEPLSVVKSLDKCINIHNPEYDPDFYENNKKEKKSSEVWLDARMMPFIKLDCKKPLTLGMYIEHMNKHCKIEAFSRIEFIPTLNFTQTLKAGNNKIFNTFKGFPYVGKMPQKMYDIEKSKFYAYLRDYFFRKDLIRFNRFLDWIADMFQDPTHLKPYTPVIIGKQGTLKSMLGKFISRLIGKHNSVTVINTERFFGNFNAATTEVLLQIFEELAEDKISHAMQQILKGEITEERIMKENKGENQRLVRNFARKMLFGNHIGIRPEIGERRFDFIMMDNSKANDTEYFKPIIDEMNDEDYIISFFIWITERIYDTDNLRRFERSSDTNNLILNNLPAAIKFLKDEIEIRFNDFNIDTSPPETDYIYRISSADLNEKFRRKNTKVAEDTLKRQFEEIGIKMRKMVMECGKHGTNGYILYPPHIEKLIQEYTSIKSFSFNFKCEDIINTLPLDVQLHIEKNNIKRYELGIKESYDRIRQIEELMKK